MPWSFWCELRRLETWKRPNDGRLGWRAPGEGEGDERQLGAQHPDTLLSVSNLAALLQAQGKLAEAEPLVRRCAGSREMAAARCLGCGTQHEWNMMMRI